MKKIFSFLAIIFVVASLASCTKKFEFFEIDSNETAIVVPFEGDTEQQAKLNALEFYEQNLVSGKRLTVPYKKYFMGDGTYENKLIAKVLRAPNGTVTRLWYNETRDGKEIIGDKRGIATETKSSAGITIGVTLSARIVNHAKYFFWKRSGEEFTALLDTDMYAKTTSLIAEQVASYEDMELVLNKMAISNAVMKGLNNFYFQYGIEVTSFGIYGGIIFDNPAIQAEIDNLVIQQNKYKAAKAEVAAAEARTALIPIERQWAEIEVRKATAEYIKSAAAKGISLIPQVQGTGGGVIVDLTSGK